MHAYKKSCEYNKDKMRGICDSVQSPKTDDPRHNPVHISMKQAPYIFIYTYTECFHFTQHINLLIIALNIFFIFGHHKA